MSVDLQICLETPRTMSNAVSCPWHSILRPLPCRHQLRGSKCFAVRSFHHQRRLIVELIETTLVERLLNPQVERCCEKSKDRHLQDRCQPSVSLSEQRRSRKQVHTSYIKRKADKESGRHLVTTHLAQSQRTHPLPSIILKTESNVPNLAVLKRAPLQ